MYNTFTVYDWSFLYTDAVEFSCSAQRMHSLTGDCKYTFSLVWFPDFICKVNKHLLFFTHKCPGRMHCIYSNMWTEPENKIQQCNRAQKHRKDARTHTLWDRSKATWSAGMAQKEASLLTLLSIWDCPTRINTLEAKMETQKFRSMIDRSDLINLQGIEGRQRECDKRYPECDSGRFFSEGWGYGCIAITPMVFSKESACVHMHTHT